MCLRCCLLSMNEPAIFSALCLFLRYPLTPHRFRLILGCVGRFSAGAGGLIEVHDQCMIEGAYERWRTAPNAAVVFNTLRLSWGEETGPLFGWLLIKPAANFPNGLFHRSLVKRNNKKKRTSSSRKTLICGAGANTAFVI